MSPTEVSPRGPFSLAASSAFAHLAPSGQTGADDGLDLAFAVEGSWRPVGVRVEQPGGADTAVVVRVTSAAASDAAPAVAQVVRMLSLDVDGTGWPEVGVRDPVISALQQRFSGLRPVQFHSPYEAAAWAVMGQRVRMAQTAALRQRMVLELGDVVDVDGRERRTFPSPQRLVELGTTRGLTSEKVERLRALARAALDGVLDGEALRAVEAEEALERVSALPGIGPFSAELVVVRGAGHPDVVPTHEPRLASAVGDLYGLGGSASAARLHELAEPWRPFRSWVSVLVRASVA